MSLLDLAKKFHVWISVTFNIGKGEKPGKKLQHQNCDEIQFKQAKILPVEYIDEEEGK